MNFINEINRHQYNLMKSAFAEDRKEKQFNLC